MLVLSYTLKIKIAQFFISCLASLVSFINWLFINSFCPSALALDYVLPEPNPIYFIPCIFTPTLLMLQAKLACFVVTPQEYDEASLRHPNCCPLVMMGDRRSGQQLLDSAAEDLQQPMECLASSPEGRARLDCLAEHLEQLAQSMGTR